MFVQTAAIVEQAGVDAITVTTIHDYLVTKALFSSFLPHEPAKLIPYAAAVKESVSLPVVTVGRIDPEVADRAIGEGKFDFMAMGRKQIADADFARHLVEGGVRSVRPCIYDYRCLSQAMLNQPLRCAVNRRVGSRRRTCYVRPDPAPGGGGRRRSGRYGSCPTIGAAWPFGHPVGGNRRAGWRGPGGGITYRPNGHFVRWLEDRLEELEVDVKLNSPASLESIRALEPDVVIVATGAIQGPPEIQGRHFPHVHDASSLHSLLLGAHEADGREPVVIIGGDLVGMQLAESYTNKAARSG